jgi:hypothetical protein
VLFVNLNFLFFIFLLSQSDILLCEKYLFWKILVLASCSGICLESERCILTSSMYTEIMRTSKADKKLNGGGKKMRRQIETRPKWHCQNVIVKNRFLFYQNQILFFGT